ncbi:MAG: histone deacetylase [Armatimonadota bacterium]
MTPAILYDALYLAHDTGRGHPETARRLQTVVDLLRARGLWERLEHLDPKPASREALEAVHDPTYLALLRQRSARGGGTLTPDTTFSLHSWDAAVLAAGATVDAVDAVLSGRSPSAFALVRPPGHHATREEGMGFCLINHVAVAARHAVRERGLSRVLVVDFDVHHGNGTQDIFYEDPSVLYFSSHQYPAYPGTGALPETGRGAGEGATLNVPLPEHTGDAGYLRVMQEVLAPAARRFRPELILVSAGYDAHWSNTRYLNSIRMGVTVRGFAAWVALLADLARELCDGRLAFTLEGGYDQEALAWSVDATFRVLLGEEVEDPIGPPPPRPEPDVSPIIEECRRLHRLGP